MRIEGIKLIGVLVILSGFQVKAENNRGVSISFSMGPGAPYPDAGLLAIDYRIRNQWLEMRWSKNGEVFGESSKTPSNYINDFCILYGTGRGWKN